MLRTRILREATIILVVSVSLALGFNALRPDGLPLRAGATGEEAAAEAAAEPAAVETAPGAIDLAAAAERHREGGTTVFVDARVPGEYAAGHIAGALNLPLQRFDEYAGAFLDRVPPDASIITYCDGPHCDLAQRLAERLAHFGFPAVRHLPNGLTRWRDAGMPVTH